MSSEPDVSISDTMQRQLLLGELDTEDGSSSESEDSFPTTLNEFGYKFNDKGELVSTVDSLSRFNFNVKEGNHAYNQKHYEALGEVVTEHIYQIMENELAMQRHFIPVYSSDVARSFFFMTSGALSKQKLMVLIHGSGVVRAGQWSRRLIINEDLDQGSQLPYIRRAVQDDFGVIVLNTNVNEVTVEKD